MRVASIGCLLCWLCACASEGDVLVRLPPDEPRVPRAADDFVESIGVTLMPIASLDFEHDVHAPLSELGVRHVREWATVPGDADSAAQNDALLQLGQLGIRSHLIIEPRFGVLPEHLPMIASALGDALESVEGANDHDANEIDLSAAQVVDALRDLRTAIDDNDLAERVKLVDALDGAPEAKGDLSAIVDYGNFERPRDQSLPAADLGEQKAAARVVCGAKPIMVTECGYSTAPSAERSVSERAAAKYTLRLLLAHFAQNIARTYLDELSDADDPTMDFMAQGLLRNDGSAKPAFGALQRLIALLADPGPPFPLLPLELTIVEPPDTLRSVLLQQRDGRHLLVLWLELESYDAAQRRDLEPDPVEVQLRMPAARDVRVYAPLDGEEPLLERRDVQELSLDIVDHPLVLVLAAPR